MKNLVSLGDVVQINPRPPKQLKADPEKPVSFLPMACVFDDANAPEPEERAFKEVSKGYTYFERNDVLLAKITPCFENGKAAFLDSLPHAVGFGSTEFHVLRATSKIDPKYLFYMVWNPRFRFSGERNMTGSAGQKRVPVDFLKKYKIPLPPLEEQKRIAAILDKADGIRRKRQQAMAMADEFLCSVFLDMFGDPVVNPKGWEVKEIKEIGKVTTGNTPSRKRPDYYGEDIEWIKSDNINTPSNYLTRAAEGLSSKGKAVGRTVGKDAILVTCIAGSPDCIGNLALADREVAFNQQINALETNDKVDTLFMYSQLMVGKKLIQKASTNSMKGMVSKGKFELIPVMVPPIEMQLQFTSIFRKQMNMVQNMELHAEQGAQYFSALAQDLFRSNEAQQ